jgi:peptidoglycan-associated lipoprotein
MRKARILYLKTGILLVAILALAFLASCCPQERVKPVVEQPPPPPVVEKPTPPPPVVEQPTPTPPPLLPPPPVQIVLEPIYFGFNMSVLTAQSQQILDRNVQELRDNPKATIKIEGNCDARGSADYNQRLGQRRADAAKAYLMSLGISEDRIISTTSNGNEDPKYPGSNEVAWEKNRRVDFILSK